MRRETPRAASRRVRLRLPARTRRRFPAPEAARSPLVWLPLAGRAQPSPAPSPAPRAQPRAQPGPHLTARAESSVPSARPAHTRAPPGQVREPPGAESGVRGALGWAKGEAGLTWGPRAGNCHPLSVGAQRRKEPVPELATDARGARGARAGPRGCRAASLRGSAARAPRRCLPGAPSNVAGGLAAAPAPPPSSRLPPGRAGGRCHQLLLGCP